MMDSDVHLFETQQEALDFMAEVDSKDFGNHPDCHANSKCRRKEEHPLGDLAVFGSSSQQR